MLFIRGHAQSVPSDGSGEMVKTLGSEVYVTPPRCPPAARFAMLLAQEQAKPLSNKTIGGTEVFRGVPNCEVVTPPTQYRVKLRDNVLQAPAQGAPIWASCYRNPSERTRAGLASARARGKMGGGRYKMTTAKLRLAMAAMGKPETRVSDLCRELGIVRQTLYRHVAPDGTLRKDGKKLLEGSGQPKSAKARKI